MCMKEVLDLHYSICNGPHPHMTLWQASTTSIMHSLEVLQLVPLCTNDVSNLNLSMLLHFTEPHAEIEDFEDYVELWNEVFTLEQLELQTQVDDATENEAKLSSKIGCTALQIGVETPSLHLATRTTQPFPGNSGTMDPETPTLQLATRTAEPLPSVDGRMLQARLNQSNQSKTLLVLNRGWAGWKAGVGLMYQALP